MLFGRMWYMWISNSGLRVSVYLIVIYSFSAYMNCLVVLIVSWVCSFCTKDLRFLLMLPLAKAYAFWLHRCVHKLYV